MWRLAIGLMMIFIAGCSSINVYENSENSYGQNDLMRAVYYQDMDTFKVEVNKAKDLYQTDSTGANILHYIAKYGTKEMAEYILKFDTQTLLSQVGGLKKITPLHEALIERNVAVANILYEATPEESYFEVDMAGRSLLHFAYISKQEEMVSDLLKRGVDPNIQDHDGNTPFHLLLYCLEENNCNGYSRASTLELLDYGLNLYAVNEVGETSMQLLEGNKAFFVRPKNYLHKYSNLILLTINRHDRGD